MAKNNNLTDFLTDVANAIREKKGTTDLINPQDFSSEIASIETGGGGGTSWTGHADADGLRAIGWTDEDIAYYQANGVNWNEEDDQYHLVSDDNKALYGVLTATNISSYRDRIVYLPKINTSGVTDMALMFQNCYSLVSIPLLDTSNATSMSSMFNSCRSLVSIPLLDTSNVRYVNNMFYNCYSLVSIPLLDTSNVDGPYYMFYNCHSLVSIPLLDTSNVSNPNNMFYNCYSLVSVPQFNMSNITSINNMRNMFYNCSSLIHAKLSGLRCTLDLSIASKLAKESLLYIINNEVATSAITIKLHSYAYARLAGDANIVAALANHPNISLSK